MANTDEIDRRVQNTEMAMMIAKGAQQQRKDGCARRQADRREAAACPDQHGLWQAEEGSKVLPRNQYTAIRDDKPKTKEEAKRPEFKVCKVATDAIITEGIDIGTVH